MLMLMPCLTSCLWNAVYVARLTPARTVQLVNRIGELGNASRSHAPCGDPSATSVSELSMKMAALPMRKSYQSSRSRSGTRAPGEPQAWSTFKLTTQRPSSSAHPRGEEKTEG